MLRLKVKIFLLIALMFSLFTGSPAFAGVDDIAKQADKIIRNAERNMFNGKNVEADQMLNEATALIAQGKAEEPDNSKLMSAEQKLERIRKQLDRKLGKTTQTSSSASPVLPVKTAAEATSSAESSTQPQAAVQASKTKLPGGVKKRLGDITNHLENAERYVKSDSKKANYQLEQAQALFGEIEKMYVGQFDPAHPDFVAVKTRYDSLADAVAAKAVAESEAQADAAASKEAMERQSAEWVEKFRPYLAYPGQQGHDPDKLVFVPGTSEPEKFTIAQQHYDAFKTFYEDYKKVEFPHGKTYALEDLADNEAPRRLEQFEEEMASRIDSVAGSAEGDIDAAMSYLEKDNGWTSDKTVKPNLIDRRRMDTIRESVDRVKAGLGDSPRSKELQAKFATLVAKDKENREIRKERTFMTSDRYQGPDIDALKEKASSLVKNDRKGEGGEPLRTTIISENWREETVEEWTDTSKTTWRKRTTRHITAQVAAKSKEGVRLVTVALAKDKQSDGSWGPLYGNLHQHPEPMLEENVSQ